MLRLTVSLLTLSSVASAAAMPRSSAVASKSSGMRDGIQKVYNAYTPCEDSSYTAIPTKSGSTNCLKIITTNLPYIASDNACKASKGSLGTIRDSVQRDGVLNTLVTKTIRDAVPDRDWSTWYNQNIWIGLHMNSDKQWTWHTGANTVSELFWDKSNNEPSNRHGNEYCAQLSFGAPDNFPSGTYNDHICEQPTYLALCEYNPSYGYSG